MRHKKHIKLFEEWNFYFEQAKIIGIINEVKNPYNIEWISPTEEYFKQELGELLGNNMRFSKSEFFNPKNYDLVYSLFPHTFKIIAEHSKGNKVEGKKEIKKILLNKEIVDLMDDWFDFREILLKDSRSIKEALNLFNTGKMEEWDNNKISQTFHMGKLSEFFPGVLKNTTSSGLLKHLNDLKIKTKKLTKSKKVSYDDQFDGYIKNIKDIRTSASLGENLKLPPPFIMELPSGRKGNIYTLIGGHKRSTIANQLNIPIIAWFIKISK